MKNQKPKSPKNLVIASLILSILSIYIPIAFIVSPISFMLVISAKLRNLDFNIKWVEILTSITMLIGIITLTVYALILKSVLLISFLGIFVIFFLFMSLSKIEIYAKGETLSKKKRLKFAFTSAIVYLCVNFYSLVGIWFAKTGFHYGTPIFRPKK